MKFVIAGTGSIGQRHIRNLQELDPECVFVLLRSDGRADALSISLAAPVVRNLDEALEHAPDALIIATPSALHYHLLLPAISIGLPIYIEKPVLTKRKDLEIVRAAMAQQGYHVSSMVGCNLRYLPSLQRLYDLVGSGSIGQVCRASFESGQWLPDWRPSQDYRLSYSSDPDLGGGVIMDLVHEIDAARWLLGELEPVGALAFQVPALEITSEAVAGALLKGKDNRSLIVTIALDYIARQPLRRYQIVGEKGTLTWDLPGKSLYLDSISGQQSIDCGDLGYDVAATYRTAMAEFITSLAYGGGTSQSLEEGLRSSELAILIKEKTCLA